MSVNLSVWVNLITRELGLIFQRKIFYSITIPWWQLLKEGLTEMIMPELFLFVCLFVLVFLKHWKVIWYTWPLAVILFFKFFKIYSPFFFRICSLQNFTVKIREPIATSVFMPETTEFDQKAVSRVSHLYTCCPYQPAGLLHMIKANDGGRLSRERACRGRLEAVRAL